MTELGASCRRGLSFLSGHASSLDRLRAEVLVGSAPAADALAALAAYQRDDGAVASQAGLVSGWLWMFGALDDLGALDGPWVARACARLATLQASDGSWCDEGISGESARIHATGMLGGYLARMRSARELTIDAAGSYLSSTWAPARVKGDAWAALAAYANYFANAAHEDADGALQWCGRELARGFRMHLYDAVRTVRVLAYCDAGAIPGADLRPDELLRGVVAEQQDDGGWLDPETDLEARVTHTLDALLALRRLA